MLNWLRVAVDHWSPPQTPEGQGPRGYGQSPEGQRAEQSAASTAERGIDQGPDTTLSDIGGSGQ